MRTLVIWSTILILATAVNAKAEGPRLETGPATGQGQLLDVPPELSVVPADSLRQVVTWLAPRCPPLARYGMLRFVRDVGHISGFLRVDGSGRIGTIVLNRAAPFAAPLAAALATLLADDEVTVSLGQT